MSDSAIPPRWGFGDVVVDAALHRVLVAGVPRDLEPLSFRLLQFLIENRDHVVSKDEIIAAVWNGTVVSDNAWSRAIAQIRKVIGDDSKQPSYLQTVPKVGYRLIADVKPMMVPAIVEGDSGEHRMPVGAPSFAARCRSPT